MATLAMPFPQTLPGPAPWPVLGTAGNLVAFGRDTVGYANRVFDRYGQAVALVAGGRTRIYSTDRACPGTVLAYGPEITRQATTQHDVYHKGPLIGTLSPSTGANLRRQSLQHFGTGLFGVNGQEHRRQRRLMMPALHKGRLAAYCGDMVDLTRRELDRWQPGQTLNIADPMQAITRQIVLKTLFGIDEQENSQYADAGLQLQESLRLLARPWVHLLPFDWPGLPYNRLLNCADRIRQQMEGLVEAKRNSGDDGTVMAMLLEARDEETGEPMPDSEVMAHAGVLFAAGHETSANALKWTLLLLDQHPQVARELGEELQAVLGGDPPTVESLGKLPLLEAVVKESMRVLPPVPWNGRILSTDTELAGFELPAGSEVFVSIYRTHHMPELFDEPQRFSPRRWETIAPSPYEYNPFSAGPRMCIGAAFAMMELKIILAMILQRFRLDLLPGQQIDRIGTIVMAPRQAIRMVVRPADDPTSRQPVTVRGNVHEMVDLPGR